MENDLATPERENTSSHGIDKGSLLPVAARRAAEECHERHALEADVFCPADTSKPRSVARSQSNLAACTTGAARFAQCPTGIFGSLEVNTLFVSASTIEPAARAFTNFLIGELRLWLHGAFLPVMDTIALPERPPNLIVKRSGRGACGDEMSHEFRQSQSLMPPRSNPNGFVISGAASHDHAQHNGRMP